MSKITETKPTKNVESNDGNARKTKTSAFDLLVNLTAKLSFDNLSSACKFGLVAVVLNAVLVLAFVAQPVLALVNNILVTVGNVFITIFSDRSLLPHSNTDSSLLSFVVGGIIWFATCLLSGLLCRRSSKS